MRPRLEPGTSTTIEIIHIPAQADEPDRWRATAIYRDHDGTVHRLQALRPDPDEAADAVETRLDELGIQ
ncbi:hypothetical protein [Nocardia brasiliensis]|uniref:hypothetical protein n=1 Tax=Nocardia brasiliensis TaxID=37326 RepID=UPI0024537B66|nr:hypothetical protein [Nocardia brasiliensis]